MSFICFANFGGTRSLTHDAAGSTKQFLRIFCGAWKDFSWMMMLLLPLFPPFPSTLQFLFFRRRIWEIFVSLSPDAHFCLVSLNEDGHGQIFSLVFLGIQTAAVCMSVRPWPSEWRFFSSFLRDLILRDIARCAIRRINQTLHSFVFSVGKPCYVLCLQGGEKQMIRAKSKVCWSE